MTCRILPYSATVVESTNHDFLSPGWKIAIGPLSTSALAALKNLTYDQFRAPFGRQPRRHLGGDFLCIFFCVLRFYRNYYGGYIQVVLFFKVPPVYDYSTCCINRVFTRSVHRIRVYAFSALTTRLRV